MRVLLSTSPKNQIGADEKNFFASRKLSKRFSIAFSNILEKTDRRDIGL